LYFDVCITHVITYRVQLLKSFVAGIVADVQTRIWMTHSFLTVWRLLLVLAWIFHLWQERPAVTLVFCVGLILNAAGSCAARRTSLLSLWHQEILNWVMTPFNCPVKSVDLKRVPPTWMISWAKLKRSGHR
jgi:hypothetical protein